MRLLFVIFLSATLLLPLPAARAGDEPEPDPKEQFARFQEKWSKFRKDCDLELAVQETPHFRMESKATDQIAKKVTQSLEAAYDEAAKLLGMKKGDAFWEGRAIFIMLPSRADYVKYVDAFFPAQNAEDGQFLDQVKRSGGVSSYRPFPHYISVAEAPQLDSSGYFASVFHQAGSFMIAGRCGKDAPSWLVEGYGNLCVRRLLPSGFTTCSVKGTKVGQDAKEWSKGEAWVALLKAAVAKKEDAPLETLAFAGPNEMDLPAYAKAWSLCEYMTRNAKRELARYVDLLREGQEPEAAWKGAFKFPYKVIDDRWKGYLRSLR